MLRFARSYSSPVARIQYLKAAFNHVLHEQQMVRLARGYEGRVRKRLAERDQGSWWGVGQTLPERASDFHPMLSSN